MGWTNIRRRASSAILYETFDGVHPPEAFFILIVSPPEDPIRNTRFLSGFRIRDSYLDLVSLVLANNSESFSDNIRTVRLCIYGEVRGLGTMWMVSKLPLENRTDSGYIHSAHSRMKSLGAKIPEYEMGVNVYRYRLNPIFMIVPSMSSTTHMTGLIAVDILY